MGETEKGLRWGRSFTDGGVGAFHYIPAFVLKGLPALP